MFEADTKARSVKNRGTESNCPWMTEVKMEIGLMAQRNASQKAVEAERPTRIEPL